MSQRRDCPNCKGSGNCPKCDGTGKVTDHGLALATAGLGYLLGADKKCNSCGGNGSCRRCKGKGHIAKD